VTLDHQGITWKLLKDGKTLPTDPSAVSAYLANLTPVTASKWITTLPQRGQKITATINITMDAPLTTAPASTMEALALSKAAGPATAPGTIVKTLLLFKENDGSYSANLTPPAAGDHAITGWTFEPAAELVRQTLTVPFEARPSTQAATQAATAPATAP